MGSPRPSFRAICLNLNSQGTISPLILSTSCYYDVCSLTPSDHLVNSAKFTKIPSNLGAVVEGSHPQHSKKVCLVDSNFDTYESLYSVGSWVNCSGSATSCQHDFVGLGVPRPAAEKMRLLLLHSDVRP